MYSSFPSSQRNWGKEKQNTKPLKTIIRSKFGPSSTVGYLLLFSQPPAAPSHLLDTQIHGTAINLVHV
jgi:hypothetical protein